MVILGPLPFGCVGDPWRLMFFAVLALIACFAWKQVNSRQITPNGVPERADPARELLYGRSLSIKTRKRGAMVWAARLWTGFFFFCLFQLLPLPVSFVKVISPNTVEIMTQLRGTVPAWVTISQVPRETVVFALEFLVLVAFGLGLVRLRPGWREMTALVRALGWSVALQVVFGLARMLSGSANFFLFFAPWENRAGDLTGTLVNSNHFAFFLELAAPLVLALAAVEFAGSGGRVFMRIMDTLEHRPRVIAVLLLLVLTVTGVVLSNSRAGLTALLVGVIVAGLMMARGRASGIRRLLPIGVGALALLVLLVAGGNTWKQYEQLNLDPDYGTGRIQRWPSVVEMARDYPLLGTGMGTFRWAYFPYDKETNQWVTHAHNDILETATDGGIVGFILFLGGFVFFSAAVLSRWRRRKRVSVRLLAAGGVASIAAALFHSFFDFSLRIPVNALVLVLVMALTWSVVNYRKESSRPRSLRDGGSW